MSELKVYHCNEWHNEYTEFYLKSEADKVIAELKNYADEFNKDFELVDNQNERLLKIVRHNKYKRCLLRSVIAEMNATHFKDLFYGAGSEALADEYNKQITIHYKWQKRWLALAEKFKEAK